jgi:hypothetical protein
MKRGLMAAALGCALLAGFAASAPAHAAGPVSVRECKTVLARARAYNRAHHMSNAGLKGPCTTGDSGSGAGPQRRMRKETLCHPNGNGNFCCTWHGGGAPACGSCPSLSFPCPH